jgi:arsenate reductase
MGEIATSKRQVTLFYNPKSERGKQTLAYAKSTGLAVQEVDILKTKLTGSQLAELADKLHIEVADLVNQEHPAYTSHFSHHNYSTDDWIKMIQHNPEIMKQPIALHGETATLIKTPTDIVGI